MKYKTTLPGDVRDACCAHARGYDRRCQRIRQGEATKQDRISVEAVDAAMLMALQGIRSREVRARLRTGILLNITNRYEHPYERLYVPGIGKKEFYRRKNDFVCALADELHML